MRKKDGDMNWQNHNIDVSKLRGGKMQCPKCSASRKNKTDKPLSVDLKTGLFHCHNCGFKGCAAERERPKKLYTRPPERLEKINAKALAFFENERKITNNTLLRFKISEAKEWMPQLERESSVICFNYFRDDVLVNVKFRGPNKTFKMVAGAELIFFNLDSIKGEKQCIITEGEIDCMSFYEAGFTSVVSVPNGASKGNQKLEYLDNCWEYFEDMEKVVLAVDNDEAGISLRDELARRIGPEKCYTIIYPDGCKDANDVLVRLGTTHLKEMLSDAREWPLPGIMTTEAMIPSLDEWFNHGYPKGGRAHIPGFDDLLTFAPGQITTVTGIPGHGKDEFMNWVMANLAKKEGWTIGICGFEESPEETASKLIEKLMGKAFAFRKDPSHRISLDEYHQGIGFIDQYFSILNPDEIDTDMDSLLSVATGLVKKRGIKVLYLNPWNWIEHTRPAGISETEYVSHVYTKMIKWARKYLVHIFLLAHTTKMMKNREGKKYEVPTLYSISGSANFYNKTHNGFTVFRDTDTNVADVYVQKVKQSWLGKVGFVTFNYNTMTRQYTYAGASNNPLAEKNYF